MRYGLPLLFLLPAFFASAQNDDQSIDEVVTTAKRVTDRFETTGNIAKVDEEELRTISALHIQDVLVRVPGVNIQQGNGQEYLPAVRSPVLTGGGACGAFLTAQDSIPLKAAGFCNVNELFEAYTEAAQQIEVIRGPGNALYGSNAMHGVINVVLPKVADESSWGFKSEAGANDFRRNTVNVNQKWGAHGFVANVTATHDGGYIDDAYYDQQKMHLRHEFAGDVWQVTTSFAATNLNQETAGYIVGKDAYLDSNVVTENPNPEAYRDAQSRRLYSRVSRNLDNQRELVITPYTRKTKMDFMQHFLPGKPVETNGQESVGTMFTYYDNSSARLAWIAGIDVELTDGYLTQTQYSPTEGSPFLQATIPEGKHYDYQVNAMQLSPYANFEWTFTDALTFNAGIRYEVMNYDYDNKMLTGRTRDDGTTCGMGGCRYNRPADREDTFRNWSSQVGAKYAITENLIAYTTIARGFRAPQATELYRLQNDQQVTDLDSEEVDSIEVGLRGRSDYWTYEVNAYRMEKRNVIYTDSNRANLDNGETQHLGYELQVGYQISDAWDFALSANYGDHYYTNDEFSGGININRKQVDTAPKRFGAAQLGLQLASNMRAELEFVHTGGYYTNPENTDFYDGHDLINLRAQWQPIDMLQVGVRVLNLTDERYADRADYNFGNPRYFPGEPRSAYVSVELQF